MHRPPHLPALALTAAATIATLAATVALTPPATATTSRASSSAATTAPQENKKITGVIAVYNQATGLCLDGGRGGRDIYTHQCNQGNRYQQWDIRPIKGGDNWVNVATGLCLWMSGRLVTAYGPEYGCPMNQARWRQVGPGMLGTAAKGSGNCLDSNAKGEVYGRKCDVNNPYQKWWQRQP